MALLKREQIAGMNIHYLNYSLDYFLDAQASVGIQSIELWCGAPHFWLDYMTYSDCKEIRRKIESRGLETVVLTPENCTYQYQFAVKGEDLIQKSFAYFSNGIKAAAELGCRIMAVNSGWGLHDNDNRNDAWKRSVEMLSRLSDIAREEGILLAMESLRPQESNLATTLSLVKEMYEEINHPHFKVMLDTTAMGVAGETPEQWLSAFGENLIHMHFIDGDPYGHLIWGDGIHHLGNFLRTLAAFGYTGYLGQEITDGRYFENPAVHDSRNMKNFERYLDR